MKASRDFTDQAAEPLRGVGSILGPLRAGGPTDAGHRSFVDIGDILEMIADNLPIPQVMVIMYKAVVERFSIGTANHFNDYLRQMREFFF